MDDLKSQLSRLGKTVASVSDETADPATLQNARRRWLGATALTAGAIESPPRRRALWVSLAMAACLACGVLLWTFALPRTPAISFSVVSGNAGAPEAAGAVGQWVAPESNAPLDLRFSEGTVVTLTPGARMRVTDTSPRGATLLIERGAIHAAITHRDVDTRWSLQAGPFEVRVTGTAFDARWDPTTETFELTMIEGTVVVSGPRLPSERVVVAGEQLVVSSTRMELRTGGAVPVPVPSGSVASASGQPGLAAPSAAALADAAPASSGAASSGAASSVAAAGVAAVDPSRPQEPGWKALARAGKHRDAMEAAESSGFSGEMARASAAELMSLADVARFAGRPARAREALLAMRRRFGARGSSAFLLGKIATDQLGSPGEAATWFETYLQEEPGGALAEQALGRVLEIRKRDAGAGRLVAERYLARYPNGAYAALARSLVVPR